MKIYDSRLKKDVDFKPIKEGEVSMYVCGPTVYDKAHLGHGRSAVSFDIVRKYFEYKGYNVKFVSNYTDIDDKMINRANEEGISVKELSDKVIPIYERDYDLLGIAKPTVQPKATDHIEEIIELIKDLEKNGYTYVLEDGVYYDVSKFKHYGELSGQSLDELKMGARIDVNDKKVNPYDFVLWKFKKDGEPAWNSPWGEGRPGWHIECSAMTWKHLGKRFDIHGGGLDLKFPHHECEVAQSCGAFGEKEFAQHWMHNGFIQVNNEKMSKSLGNFFTLEDIFKKYDPQVVRFMFLQTHYRNPINFSDALLDQAKNALRRLQNFKSEIVSEVAIDGSMEVSSELKNLLEKTQADFEAFMDDDFNTSGVFGVISDFRDGLKAMKKITAGDIFEIEKLLAKFDSVLGVLLPKKDEFIGDNIEKLIEERNAARKNKDFKRSDEIRSELLEKGIVLEDTSHGTIWKKA